MNLERKVRTINDCNIAIVARINLAYASEITARIENLGGYIIYQRTAPPWIKLYIRTEKPEEIKEEESEETNSDS
jgi:hypothetical protein